MTHQLALDHIYRVAAILFAGLCGPEVFSKDGPFVILWCLS